MIRSIVILLSLVSVIIAAPTMSCAEKLTVVLVTDNTPGGEFIVGGGETFQQGKPGVEIELYQLVAERLNLDLKLERHTWTGSLRMLEYNMVDGVFPASFKEERLKIGVYPMIDGRPDPSKKTRENGYALYTHKRSALTWDGKNFHNVTGAIAVPSGWAVVDELKSKGLELKELSIHEHSLELLLQGRVEGFICLESVFDSYIKSRPKHYSDIRKHAPLIWEKPYYLMLSHKFVEEHPQVANDIWEAIKEIRQSDEFQSIMSKYVE